MASVGENDLCAASDVDRGELVCGRDIIKVQSVDFDTVVMGDDHIEATWVNGKGMDDILKLLDDLQGEGTGMCRVLPHHEGLIRCRCGEDGLLHTRSDGCHLVSVEGDRQVRDLS